MKLFIDTSNKKFILAIINDKVIIDFFIQDTKNNVVENSLFWIESFLNKNNTKLSDIEKFMVTIGPGSFTGSKVGLNIVKTVNLLKKVNEIEYIDTFNLLKSKNKKNVAIKFGKSKFYLKKNSLFSKVKIIDNISKINKQNTIIDYEEFNEKFLLEKINSNSFKVCKSLDKLKIKYI